MRKLRDFFYVILLFFSTMVYASLPQAPNEVIKDNPEKEVTQIIAPKNREYAEMNLNITKVNLKNIIGFELGNGDIVFDVEKSLTFDGIESKESFFYLTDSLGSFSEITNYKRNSRKVSKINYSDSIMSNKIRFNFTESLIRIKDGGKYKELYIGKIDKKQRLVEKVWRIEKSKNYKKEKLETLNDGVYISLDVTDNPKLRQKIREREIIFLDNNFPMKESQNKINLKQANGVGWKFFPNKMNEAMGIRRDEVYFDLPVKREKKEIIYGIVQEGDGITVYEIGVSDYDEQQKVESLPGEANVTVRYALLNKPQVFRENGRYYIWLGNILRFGKQETFNGQRIYNFSVDTDSANHINLQFKGETGITKNHDSILELNQKNLISGIYKTTYLQSKNYGRNWQDFNNEVRPYGLELKPGEYANNVISHYGLAFKLVFEVTKEIYDGILDNIYYQIINTEDLVVKLKRWISNSNKPEANYILLKTGDINKRIVVSGEESVDLSNKDVGVEITHTFVSVDNFKLLGENYIKTNFKDNIGVKVSEVSSKEKAISFAPGIKGYTKQSGVTKNGEVIYDLIFYRDGEDGRATHETEVKIYADKNALDGNLEKNVINFTFKNKIFEVITEKGKLNFGDFFPGDIKVAGDIIKFKNFTDAKINITVNSEGFIPKKDIDTPTEDQKIFLEHITVVELDTTKKLENSFRLKGEASTKSSTEPGEYRGTLIVNIDIIP